MKNSLKIYAFGFFIFTLANFSAVVWAQTFKATVVGEVRDQNGGAVPNASVTITSTATNQNQTATTNEDGNYTFAQLDPGVYVVRIEASNFKALVKTDVLLETNQTFRLESALEAGNVQETVTVQAETPVVNSETSSKGEVITPRQVQDLPLNGRNFTDLALLTPGVYRRPADDDQGEGLATAGTRTDASNFILDGTNNRNDRNSGVGVNTSVDSIREFKVETSTYSAEFGRTAGAQVNVVSKSGTNRFSGTVFEYVRNNAFDAKNALAVDIAGTPEDESEKTLRRNQFGGTLGGPLPFLNFGEGGRVLNSGKDRTFFFLSYEGTRERRSQTVQTTAPSASWLRGDFSNLLPLGIRIYDPATLRCVNTAGATVNPGSNGNCPSGSRAVTDPFPNNIIPQSRFNSASRQILSRIPAANLPGSLDAYISTGINRPDRNQYLAKIDHRVSDANSFYFRYARQSSNGFSVFPSNRNYYPGFGRDTKSRNNSYAVSDTHIFNPKLINEARFGFYTQNTQNLGQNRDQDYNALFGIPGVSPGVDLQGFPAIRIDGFSEFGDRPNDPFAYKLRTFQFYDSLNLLAGNHNLKLGADILRSNFFERDVRNVRGDFRFRGRNTNQPPSSTTSFNFPTSSGARSFADFLLGLPDTTARQIGAEPADLTGTQYAFFVQDDWRVNSRLTLNLGLRYEYQTALTEATGRLANFIPELGAVVNAGDGRFPQNLVNADKNNWGPRIGFALKPFADDKTVIRGGAGIYYSLETFNPIRQQLAVQSPFIDRTTFRRLTTILPNNPGALSLTNPFPITQGSAEANPRGINPDYKQPEVYQFNLTVEREIVKDLALEVGYVGSLGRHLGLRYNINAPVPTGAIVNGAPVTARRFAAFGDIQYQDQFGNSNYNALQASLRRRFTDGLTLLVSYTFSRSIDTGSSTNNSTLGSQEFPQDIRDILRTQRGLSDFHRKHQFNGSFNYDLPFGKGRAFFGDARGLAQTLLGGWQLNGIVSLLSGRPFTPQFSAGDVSQQRPDIIGDPYANIPPGLLFNPDAFARPVASSGDADIYGNAGRNILIGPNFNSVDLSLFKNIRLAERVKLQLRAESFNVFNHPNYQLPVFFVDYTVDNQTGRRVYNNSQVGRPTQTANEGREFQFAVKLLF